MLDREILANGIPNVHPDAAPVAHFAGAWPPPGIPPRRSSRFSLNDSGKRLHPRVTEPPMEAGRG